MDLYSNDEIEVSDLEMLVNIDKELLPLLVSIPYNYKYLYRQIQKPVGFMSIMGSSLFYYMYLWGKVKKIKRDQMNSLLNSSSGDSNTSSNQNSS